MRNMRIQLAVALALGLVLLLAQASLAAEDDTTEEEGGSNKWVFLALAIIVVLGFIALNSIYILKAWESGVLLRLGKYRGLLNPGLSFVAPFISEVRRVDTRTIVLDVPRQEVITKDNSPTLVDAVVYYKVTDPARSVLQVENFRQALVNMSQTTLRAVIGDMELDEILSKRDVINTLLRDRLDHETDAWGVKVENVEIREVDPSPNVKQAMEEQTSAERERRAAILKADGEKRSAILNAEGEKQARILRAEGLRQSKILEAQGERTALILERQGEAQGLRIIAVGAAPLDAKALTVLSLDALKKLGDGQATKLIFPFEFTKLIEGAADYIGFSRKVPDRELSQVAEVERVVGESDDILGPIPTAAEMAKEMEALKHDMVEAVKAVEATAAKP